MIKEIPNLNSMMCLDVYLPSLDSVQYKKAETQIKPLKNAAHPLMGWDIFWMHAQQEAEKTKKQKEAAILKVFSQKHNWEIDLEAILAGSYEALVLTDDTQTIQWVSKGFKQMTGYDRKYAKGKIPNFLQGINTDKQTTKRISELVSLRKPFTEKVVNYRKNKEEYLCEITVYPVSNKQHEVTHFLALEREKPE